MSVEITIRLSNDEINNIVKEAVMKEARDYAKRYVNFGASITQIAYETIEKEIIKAWNVSEDKMKEVLAEKVVELINDPATMRYEVFREGHYGSKPSPAYSYLQEILKGSKPMIENAVKNFINNYNYGSDLNQLIEERARKIFNEWVKEYRQEEENDE